MKIYCGKFDSYDDFANSKDKHTLNLRDHKCHCGTALHYFCETCKNGYNHSTFRRNHKHKTQNPREVFFVAPNNIITPTIHEENNYHVNIRDKVLKECRYYCMMCNTRSLNGIFHKGIFNDVLWICCDCDKSPLPELMMLMTPPSQEQHTESFMTELCLLEIRKLFYRFCVLDLSLCEFLKELVFYSWNSHRNENDSVKKELLSICCHIWDGQEKDIANDVLDRYIQIIEELKGGLYDGFDLTKEVTTLLGRIIYRFGSKEAVKRLKVRIQE